MIYNHSQSWLAIISDCSKKIAPIFLRRILKGLAPFLPFCCEEFWKVWPLFFTILLWRIFKDSVPFLLFLMSMYVDIFTKQVIGNDLEFQITITKNVSHDHSRSWLAKAPSKWATITHIHDLIGNDCRSHSLIGISDDNMSNQFLHQKKLI